MRAGPALRPGDPTEAAAILRRATSAVAFEGGGTKADWWAERPGLVVSTAGLRGVVRHDASGGIVVARAGTPLEELQAALAPAGQWLALDPPLVDRGATVGGVFASNDAGPRRLAYGTLRDQVVGATVVTGDGVVARTGGRVIKNVAGYDLARLYCGSFGTLGLVAELALRVHPVRPHSRSLRVPCPPGAVAPLVGSLRAAGVEATALDWTGPVAPAVLVRVEQRTERAALAQADAARRAARAEGLGAELLEATAELGAWRSVDAVLAGSPGDTVVRIGTRPRGLAGAARAAADACARSGTELAFVSHAPLGLHTARLRGGRPAEVVAALRRAVAVHGGHVVTRRRGDLGAGVDRWGAAPGGLAVMKRLKERLDPAGRLAPGTFVGGI
ncbi:MAG: FAD-binding oxidoreductase [Acidimicrobiales bacterium]